MDALAMNRQLSFYRDKRVLVTGDTGFKGSWLSLWLAELGAQVTGYALPPERDLDHFNLLGLDQRIRHIDGDVRDSDALQQAVQEFQPEVIFHLAAQALVRTSYQDPKLTFDTNIGGSVNVLETVRAAPSVRALIYVTSDKCYLNKEWLWGYRENDELGGRDPYSASKAAAEIVFSAYQHSFFEERPDVGVASVRAGNVIGGGDWSDDRILPECIKALQSNQPILLRRPAATRPWQHVLEPLSGYLSLGTALCEAPGRYSGAWNFGPESSSVRTVRELADTIIEYWGGGTVQEEGAVSGPHEARLLALNCDKAHQLLGWQARWDFARTVAETTRWYKAVHANEPALPLSQQQIHAYMEVQSDRGRNHYPAQAVPR